jgi:hypothetical protein
VQLAPTAVSRRVPLGYVASAEGLPGANTQGATQAEARADPRDGGSHSVRGATADVPQSRSPIAEPECSVHLPTSPYA